MSFAISLQSDAASYPEPINSEKVFCKNLSKSAMYIV